MKTFWMIGGIVEANGNDYRGDLVSETICDTHKKIYDSEESAIAAARNLAVRKPGTQVVVLKMIGVASSDNSQYMLAA